MHVSRKHNNLSYPYSLNSIPLSEAESYRYLGIIINNKLTWSEHIENLCKDASKLLGFIRRSLAFSPRSIRQLAYETFIRSKLEYSSAIWNPYQTYLINQLEAIQNRAARFITSQYDRRHSVTVIKSSLYLQPMALRRKISQLCLFHKLYYNFPQLRSSVLHTPLRTSRRLFNSLSLQRIHGSTNSFNKSFLPSAISLWNELPDAIVTETEPNKFRQLLTVHFKY